MSSIPPVAGPGSTAKPTEPLSVLQTVFGYKAFRGPQAEIVAHVLAGGSALVLMPTGGGKSLCYQIPALCREGTAVVISPLIALMDDQVEALRQCGVRAGALHSARHDGSADTWRALTTGALDLLYVSPERLLAGDLLEQLSQRPIALFAIDEAHCVSQWGHDFRPEYRQLAVLAERFGTVPRLALTATADPRTQADIVRQLGLERGRVFTASFDRPNIRYLLRPKEESGKQLLGFLEEHRGEAGIVYARSRKRVEQVAAALERAGHAAMAYHAGMEPERRSAVLQRFRREAGVVVATIAFGMGIDKPDVRFVAHIDLPRSLEAYYQETGRAGRDGLPALAWMVHGPGDVPLLRRFIDDSEAPEEQKQLEHGKLNALIDFTEAGDCRRQLLLAHFGETLAAPCGNCDVCLEPQATMEATEPARKALSAVHRSGQRFGAAHLVDVLMGASTARIRELGHDRLSVYGIGGELDKEQWRALFRQLVQRGYLISDPERRGGLRYGADALVRPLLRGEETLHLRLPPPRRARRGAEGRSGAATSSGSAAHNGEAQERFERLRNWRREQARQQGVPPYLVFHDRTLIELANRQPQTLEDLAAVVGVGAAKLERYGSELLNVLQNEGTMQA
ncbi:MAG: DNA helicase RecQ [Cyanobacteriota bacterium]|nr:DNA helicase RecQ [Cyanobacteriota bacterium]